jgi:phosphoenolpyruvate-protein phosphotransferase (PTS system enzyme I)
MILLKGIGHVPGYAKGVILEEPFNEPDVSDKIVLLEKPDFSTIAALFRTRPAGVIMVDAAKFSHTAIYIRGINVPTVLIYGNERTTLQKDSLVLLDGYNGLVAVEPDDTTKTAWSNKSTQDANIRVLSSSKRPEPAYTRDGVRITIGASVSSEVSASDARLLGADELGLVRSEFLFTTNADPIDYDTYYKALHRLCEAASPLPVRVRLIDVGGDKMFKWVPHLDDMDEVLGIRGARVYMYEQFSSLLRCQIEVISCLSTRYEISLYIPYITSPEEFIAIRQKIEDIVGKGRIQIGAMLESPSSCFSLVEMIDIADHVALGTNDLMQGFFAASRQLKSTAQLYEPYSPALFRFIKTVADDTIGTSIPIRICGQLALLPYITPLLIGIGFRNFSVEPFAVPILKEITRGLETHRMQQVVSEALNCRGTDNFKTFIESSLKINRTHPP